MALYVIGDLHLSLSSDKPMDVFGPKWENHAQKLIEGFRAVGPEDTTVLCGDLSWAMNLKESLADFKFIDALPGRKIILKGNHDFWWSTATKALGFFRENGIESIEILNNNAVMYDGGTALCGTRGWFFEEEKGTAHDRKIMLREVGRLETSLKAAGDRRKLVFLHYPPVYQGYRCPEILELLKRYGVPLVCYGHIHGRACNYAFEGMRDGTEYRMVSADFLDFRPLKLLDS